MKIGRILGLFTVALVGALAAVAIYAKFIKPEAKIVEVPTEGKIQYLDLNVVTNAQGSRIIMNRKGGELAVMGKSGRELERFHVIYGAQMEIKDGQKVGIGDLLASWDPFTTPIITEMSGTLKFDDIQQGKTMQEKVDPVTGKSSRTIIESKSGEERPRITIRGEDGKIVKLPSGASNASYLLPVGAILMIEEGDAVQSGDIMAKIPRDTTKTKDITGGLPRVAELFEVRKPKEIAVLSEIDGYVKLPKGTKRGKQRVLIAPVDVGEEKEYLIPKGKHVNVIEGDYVRAGEALMGGQAIPQDILNIKGEIALARYLVDEVQEVYRLQGVRINDKHIEVIVRQMMQRVKVTSVGDTKFIPEEQVDRRLFQEENERVIAKGDEAAMAEPLILGITKASLSTESWISAASFQETTKVLTEASIGGTVDSLHGLKENVIMGRLIPAGTGVTTYREAEIN